MELSQTALAVMLVYAVPIGVVLNVAYRLTDLGKARSRHAIIMVLQNVKDFLFMITAALMVVLLVYYANDGQFRYVALVGVPVGYWLSERLIAKPLLLVRHVLWRLICRIMAYLSRPLAWMIGKTLGKSMARAQSRAMIRKTEQRASWWTAQASYGFENNTEAKAWKNKKNNRTRL